MELDHLVCPYNDCKKEFEKPLMLTDFTKTPRETYYACPHCLTKINPVAEDSNVDSISVKASRNHVEKAPTGCGHHFGYLKTLPNKDAVPEECLTCSQLLQCLVKK